MNLNSMSIERLTSLRHRVEAAPNAKVIEQRRTLQSELTKLGRFGGGAARLKSAFGRGARGSSCSEIPQSADQ